METFKITYIVQKRHFERSTNFIQATVREAWKIMLFWHIKDLKHVF